MACGVSVKCSKRFRRGLTVDRGTICVSCCLHCGHLQYCCCEKFPILRLVMMAISVRQCGHVGFIITPSTLRSGRRRMVSGCSILLGRWVSGRTEMQDHSTDVDMLPWSECAACRLFCPCFAGFAAHATIRTFAVVLVRRCSLRCQYRSESGPSCPIVPMHVLACYVVFVAVPMAVVRWLGWRVCPGGSRREVSSLRLVFSVVPLLDPPYAFYCQKIRHAV